MDILSRFHIGNTAFQHGDVLRAVEGIAGLEYHLRDVRAYSLDVHVRSKVELQVCAVRKGEEQFAVNVQEACGLHAEILNLRVGIGGIRYLLAREALHVCDNQPLVGEDHLIAYGLEGLGDVFARNEKHSKFGANVGNGDFPQIQ